MAGFNADDEDQDEQDAQDEQQKNEAAANAREQNAGRDELAGTFQPAPAAGVYDTSFAPTAAAVTPQRAATPQGGAGPAPAGPAPAGPAPRSADQAARDAQQQRAHDLGRPLGPKESVSFPTQWSGWSPEDMAVMQNARYGGGYGALPPDALAAVQRHEARLRESAIPAGPSIQIGPDFTLPAVGPPVAPARYLAYPAGSPRDLAARGFPPVPTTNQAPPGPIAPPGGGGPYPPGDPRNLGPRRDVLGPAPAPQPAFQPAGAAPVPPARPVTPYAWEPAGRNEEAERLRAIELARARANALAGGF